MFSHAEKQEAPSVGHSVLSGMNCIADYIEQETDHRLLGFNPENLRRLKDIKRILVVGPSGAGKSSFVDTARGWLESTEGKKSPFVIPKRIVSRPQRENDNLQENDFATTMEEFDQKTADGVRWKRKMDIKESGRIEWYGFEKAPTEKIPIYSANLAFLGPDAELTGLESDFLEHTLVVYIYALPHVRQTRLEIRSPDIIMHKPEEARKRLAPDTDKVYGNAHLILRTRSFEKERHLAEEVMFSLLDTVSRLQKQ